MPPAGYLAYKGEMSFSLAVLSGVLGSLSGALFNYFIAYRFGRPFIMKYGECVFISREKFKKIEDFFDNHGEITTFIGRLLPGVRQYISFPPGLAKMNLFRFSFYTALGAAIWVFILTYLGYAIGKNEKLLKENLNKVTFLLLLFSFLIVLLYIKKKKAGSSASHQTK